MSTTEKEDIDKKHSNFTMHLMISYSAILLIILCMGIYLYSISVNNIQTGIREQNLSILENSIAQLDNDFVSMSSLASQLADRSSLVHLANKESSDDGEFYMLAYEAKKEMANLLPSHMLLPIESYFIRLRNTDYLISFSYFEDMIHYYSKNRRLEKSQYEQWKTMVSDSENHYKMIPVSPYSREYTTNANNYLYLMSLESFSFKKIPADICFELSMEQVNQIFSELNLYSNGFIIAYDPKGNPVFSISAEDKPMDQKAIQEFSTTLEKLDLTSTSYASYNNSSGKMLLTTAISSHNKWVYYLVQPSNPTFYSIVSYQTLFTFCVISALVLGFLIIFLLSRKNSRPLADMSHLLTLSRIKEQELLQLAKQQQPLLRTSYVRQIMKGTISSNEEMNYVKDYLKLSTSITRSYTVLYCTIYLNKYEVNTEGTTMVGISTFDYDTIMKKVFIEFFGEPLYLYSPHDRSYALLLSSDSEDDYSTVAEQVVQDFHKLHDYLMEQHSIWVSGGLGNRNDCLEFTWKSYQQAMEAVRYTTNEHFFSIYEALSKDSHTYYYPPELAHQLTNFMNSGNKQQIEEIFKLLKKENLSRRSLPFKQMDWLLSDIRNTLLKSRFSIDEHEDNGEDLKVIDLHIEEMPSLKLYEDIAMRICHITRGDTSENQLISHIKTYIAKNYHDPSLCLSKISEEFSISESYFSYLFKKTTGENFSAYLERIRMDQALCLIKDSQVKITNLYTALGYNNPTSFRRAFKKIHGVSPASLRDSTQPKQKTEDHDS